MGLNDNFKSVRANILMLNPLPSLSKAYRLVLQEERERDCSSSQGISYDSSALASSYDREAQAVYYDPSAMTSIYNQNPGRNYRNSNHNNQTGSYPSNSQPQHFQHGGSSQEVVFGITPTGWRSKFFCTNNKVYGHSIYRCYTIHGYPNGAK